MTRTYPKQVGVPASVYVPVAVPDSTGAVNVLLVSVCVSVVPTTAPAGLPTPPAGNVTPAVPSTMVAPV